MSTTWFTTLILLLLANTTSTMSKEDASSRESKCANDFNLVSWNASTSKTDYVVAKDGSGNYKTIHEAIKALEQKRRNDCDRAVIYVKTGVYAEYVQFNMTNIMFVGDGIDKTIITGNRSNGTGWATGRSATFGVYGDDFWAKDITFENTAGPENHQAVAIHVISDRAVFYRCSFKGFQDTLYAHSYRQFYRECQVYGTIDFIFGDATAVFQNCDIYVRKPSIHKNNAITAHGRNNATSPTGFSIHMSRVLPAPDYAPVRKYKSYLGRPWGNHSRTVFMKTHIDGLIDPEGWETFSGNVGLSTLYYGEYMNSGDGAYTTRRVNWTGFHLLTKRKATRFTVSSFIDGDSWINVTGVPYMSGL